MERRCRTCRGRLSDFGRPERIYCSAACRRRAFEQRHELEEVADTLERVAELVRDGGAGRLERVAELLRAEATVEA
jgi:hypothetical protein